MTETPDKIPQSNELLYTLKLITGEELLCTLVDEQDTGIIIESPIQIKLIPVYDEGKFRNELSSCAWMPFSATRSFHIRYSSIVSINHIHPSSHVLYTKLVNRFEPIDDPDESSPTSFHVDPVDTIQ